MKEYKKIKSFIMHLSKTENTKQALEELEAHIFESWGGAFPPTLCALAILEALSAANILPYTKAYFKRAEEAHNNQMDLPAYSVFDFYHRYDVFDYKNTSSPNAWNAVFVLANSYFMFMSAAEEIAPDSMDGSWGMPINDVIDEDEDEESGETVDTDDEPHGFGA